MDQTNKDYHYRTRVRALCDEFGISAGEPEARGLVLWPEPTDFVTVALSATGSELQLIPEAAYAWAALRAAAAADGVELRVVSAFRSLEWQAAIIRRKLANGSNLDAILAVNAPPGYSEHHSGCAIDIGTLGCPDLEDVFETTLAFRWLSANAAEFSFVLSFPRGNAYGYVFEPWHWRYWPPSGCY
jgi:D-alanyl-D-alanine carboxypeptidase